MTRHTADSITDDELDALYDQLARLRGAAGDRGGGDPRDALSSPLTASQGSGGAPDVGGRDGASGGRTANPDAERRQRYADAIRQAEFVARFLDPADLADAVLAVADAEQAELRARLEERTRQLGEVRTRTTELEARVNGELAEAEAVVERVERANALLDVVALELEHWDGGKSLDLLRRELDIYRGDAAPQAGDGIAVLTVVVTAPTQENADHWARTIRDLITAEHGDQMRLDMTINPGGEDGRGGWQQHAEKAEAALNRVRAVVKERRTEVAEYEAENPPSGWSDTVTVTCDRIEDALREPSPSPGIYLAAPDTQQQP